MKVATFWEGRKPPAYMTLCITTWLNYLELSQITVLNHNNVRNYVGHQVSLDDLKMFSFAKQSDIVSATYLNTWGGAFLDVDGIMISDGVYDFLKMQPGDPRLRFFGGARTGIHIGNLVCNANAPAIKQWAEKATVRVEQWAADDSWSYVGNDLINPYAEDPANKHLVERLLIDESYGMPERQLYGMVSDDGDKNVITRYKKFWFAPHQNSDDVIEKIETANCGLVSLHNSWTPQDYADMSVEQIMDDDNMLSKFLKRHMVLEKYEEVEDLLTYGS